MKGSQINPPCIDPERLRGYRYLEICAGIGGTRAGLTQAGWQCKASIDIDPDAVEVHRRCFGDGQVGDIRLLEPQDLPSVEVLVAGFPCQPFSTSGPRLGFDHDAGNVFDHLARVIAQLEPQAVLLENVRGLIVHEGGQTFKTILDTFLAIGYRVDWTLLDLTWFDVPQSRPRIIMVGTKAGSKSLRPGPAERSRHGGCPDGFFFSSLVEKHSLDLGPIREIGAQRSLKFDGGAPLGQLKFSPMGMAFGDTILTWDCSSPVSGLNPISLGRVVAPDFYLPGEIRSVRFYARGRPTRPHFRSNGIAHCVGNVPGSAPLFSVPLEFLRDKKDREAFLVGSNWSTESEGQLIMRLTPSKTLRLFGPWSEGLQAAIEDSPATLSKKYRLVADLFAPVCAYAAASLL